VTGGCCYLPPALYQTAGAPPAPPPGGYACGVAWQNFMSQQINCYGQWAGTSILIPVYDAVDAAYRYNLACGANLFKNLYGTVGYLVASAGRQGMASPTASWTTSSTLGAGPQAGCIIA
jgi:hypothetical protein